MNLPSDSVMKPLRVAIIGAGPSGFYTAGQLFKEYSNEVLVDMFDRLPTPFGLVRYGVAPDHQKIKSVTNLYDRIADHPGFRFWGNVEIGQHIQISELKEIYHCIVFAYGASQSRQLGILGEDFKGSHAATDFVAWYNGHPDYRDLKFNFAVDSAVVVGMGNVAIDVARILCLTEEELIQSDIADYALEALVKSNIREVIMLGRRGPAQAAFTNPELKELSELQGADLYISSDEAKLDLLSEAYVEDQGDKTLKSKMELINKIAKLNSFNKSKRITIRFLTSPVEIFGDEEDNVSGMRLVGNELYSTDTGIIKSIPTDTFHNISVGMVLRSVGYLGSAISGIPFNSEAGIVPNINGRIINKDTQEFCTGLYTAGWIKRGPTGVIGTNKGDAIETVKCIVEDVKDGNIIMNKSVGKTYIEEFVRDRQQNLFTFDDWKQIDEIERENGKLFNRPRIKFNNTQSMLQALDRA